MFPKPYQKRKIVRIFMQIYKKNEHLYIVFCINTRFWWAEVDSNHRSRRRQIYSLIHLAALESAHLLICVFCCGAGDWTRTHNLLITNQLLCQLSYTGIRRLPQWHCHFCGALGRNRTTDRQIFSLLLYRLSYQGICGDPKRARTVDLQRDRLAL